MRFYLASWVGDGTDENGFRPNVDAESWAAIDFRPDPTVQEGRVVVATDQPLSTLPSDVVDLGDLLDDVLRRPNIRGIEQRLGVTLQGQSLRQIIAELLIVHGETDLPGRTRWKRLKATSRGRHVIKLLGQTLYDAPAIVGTTITESFNKADSTVLGPDLTWTEIEGDMAVVSNAAANPGGAAPSIARAEHDLASDDHYVQGSLGLGAAQTRHVNLIVRFDQASTGETTDANWYRARWLGNGSGVQISKRVSGAFTQLVNTNGLSLTSGLGRFEVDGSALEMFHAGVSQASTTDTAITGYVRTGFSFQNSGCTLDNFEAGDLGGAGAQTLTGTSFTKAPTFPQGTVAPGAVTLSGTTFQQAPTFPGGTVTTGADLAGVTFQKAPTFPGGTITAGAVDLAGTTFTKAPTFPTGAVDVGAVDLVGTVFQKAPTFPQGTVAAGALSLTGTTFQQAPTFPQGTVAVGAVDLTGTTFQKAPTFPGGTVSLDTTQNLTGAVFQRAPTFPQGTVTAGAVDLTGVTFTKAPTFPQGAVEALYDLTGTTFTKAPTFPQGAVTVGAVTVVGVTFTTAPTFPTGTITESGDTFWSRNPVGYTKNPVGFTKVGPDSDPPW